MVIVRLFIIVMVISTLLFVVLSYLGRMHQRDKLISQWAAEMRIGDRDGWLADELAKYDQILTRRLIWLVYGLPLGFVAVIGIMLHVQNYM